MATRVLRAAPVPAGPGLGYLNPLLLPDAYHYDDDSVSSGNESEYVPDAAPSPALEDFIPSSPSASTSENIVEHNGKEEEEEEEEEEVARPKRSGSCSASASAKKRRAGSATPSGSLPPCRTERKYKCEFEGCDKAYFKPSRLAEHVITHTGERPFSCTQCSQTYLRESHLKAHMRTHMSQENKPFPCTRSGCGKSFWTPSHLRRHEEVHDKALTYDCEHCGMAFSKAHMLRDHVTIIHMPPGTKPYPCTHEGCSESFDTSQHRKRHEKTHDPSRYSCTHPSHGGTHPTFPKWTALQSHIHTAHPPTCHYPDCYGRTFKDSSRLKSHLRVHAEQEQAKAALAERVGIEGEVPQLLLDGMIKRAKRRRSVTDDDGSPAGPTARKLGRVAGDIGKAFSCGYEGCGKKFKTKYALTSHTNIIHLKTQSFACPHEGCEKTYPHKANLKKHIETHNRPEGATTPLGSAGGSRPGTPSASALFAGAIKEERRFLCPAHAAAEFCGLPAESIRGLGAASATQGGEGSAEQGWEGWLEGRDETTGACELRFWRVYDVRRHLKAEHGVCLEDLETRKLLLFTGQTGQ